VGEGDNRLAIQRLTALWALNESGLGGLLHAFNSPFTGLIVGSIAIVLISLMCVLSTNKWQTILTALTIVLIVKAAVAPHSNVTAYFAVSFQAILGALLFTVIKSTAVASTLLATLSLIESSLQKILGWTIIYGKTFWQAIDDFGFWLSQKLGYLMPMAASKALIILYISLHAVAGILVGVFCSRLLVSVKENWGNEMFAIDMRKLSEFSALTTNDARRTPWGFYIGISITIGILAAYGYYTGGWEKGLYVLVRTTLVLVLLYVIIAPLLLKLVNKILRKRKAALADEIDQIFNLFPYLRILIGRAWATSSSQKYYKRWYAFILFSVLYVLHFKKE
jgi:hypothetical protein